MTVHQSDNPDTNRDLLFGRHWACEKGEQKYSNEKAVRVRSVHNLMGWEVTYRTPAAQQQILLKTLLIGNLIIPIWYEGRLKIALLIGQYRLIEHFDWTQAELYDFLCPNFSNSCYCIGKSLFSKFRPSSWSEFSESNCSVRTEEYPEGIVKWENAIWTERTRKCEMVDLLNRL